MWCRSCAGLSKIAGRSEIGLVLLRRCFSSATEGKRFAALWGNGDYGRLGLGNLDSQWKPAVCSSFDNSLRAIACGGAHTLFLTESGRVYASGLNKFGQLGISDDNSYIVEPVEVSGFKKDIKQIAAGYNHSCAITEDGELYVWGKNSSGQLGLGKKAPKLVPRPTKVENLAGMKIKVVALGSEHSIAVTDEGLTLSWGSGQSGRLGHGHQSSILGFLHSNSEYTPRLIKDLEGIKVKSVSAGLLHSACIDENGCVFLFGEKAVDKLGFGKPNNETTPMMLQEIPFCEDVVCGGYHTCIITCGGELYTWGSNENGCLGIGYTEVAHQPERVLGPFLRESVCKVSCGWKHTAAISDGQIFTWGWGGTYGTFAEDGHSSAGQLGHGTDVDYVEPARIDFGRDVKAVDLSCGFNHTGMAVEYESKMDYYGEVYDLLKIAKQAVHPWGGKKLSDDLWAHFMKHIVDGDQELSDLRAVGNSFAQEFQAIKASPGDSLAELERKDIELLMLKLCVDVNLMHMKRLIRHAERLKGMLVASCI